MTLRRTGFLVIALGFLIAWPGQADAQRGGSRGGSDRGRGGDSGGDRAEQMRQFFSRMRESREGGSRGSGGGDRAEQMRSFFSRMREGRDGGGGSCRDIRCPGYAEVSNLRYPVII